MLVLTRRQGEGIRIGHDVRVVVVEIRQGGMVRLGIEAPRDIEVDRDEVRMEKERGSQEGSGGRRNKNSNGSQHAA